MEVGGGSIAMKSQHAGAGTFVLIDFEEGGDRIGRDGRRRLVCNIEGGGKIVIWGSERAHGNIDAVLRAGLPCKIECDHHEPAPWAERYGHTHWVAEDSRLEVLGRA